MSVSRLSVSSASPRRRVGRRLSRAAIAAGSALAITGVSFIPAPEAMALTPGCAHVIEGFGYTNGIKTLNIPSGATQVDITAAGASGGADGADAGGAGAVIATSNVALPAGAVALNVLVGGPGTQGSTAAPLHAGGGGGGTFVYTTADTTGMLVAAGGGGGAGLNTSGLNATTTPDGTSTGNALAGTGGSGAGGYSALATSVASGGAGVLTGGGAGLTSPVAIGPLPASTTGAGVVPPSPATEQSGGSSPSVGGAGGAGQSAGGFGGGGAAGTFSGGGGGGYSGGAGGVYNVSGGGGGSYSVVAPTSAVATNTGDGYVTISWIAPVTVSFDLNGGTGTVPADQTIQCGATAAAPSVTPQRAGYTFAGWSTTASGGTSYSTNPIALTTNTTLYAQWAVPLSGPGGKVVPALTVTAPSPTITQGDSLPSLQPTYAGFINADSPSSLTTRPTCTTTATSTSPAGTYPVTCTGAVDTNYAITYVAGTLTIQAKAPVITPAAPHTHVIVNPSSVRQGGRVTITGFGFQPGEQVSVVTNSKSLHFDMGSANAQGTVTIRTTIPMSVAIGHYTVTLTGTTSQRTTGGLLRVIGAAKTPVKAKPVKKPAYPTQAATGYGDPAPTPIPSNRSESTSSVLAVLDTKNRQQDTD